MVLMVDRSDFWFLLRFLGNFGENYKEKEGAVINVSFAASECARNFKNVLFTSLKLGELASSPDVVFRLRDYKNILRPISWNLISNTQENPYVLEIVRFRPEERVFEESTPLIFQNAVVSVQKKISDLTQRLDAVEKLIPGLGERHEKRVTEELQSLSQQISYMERHVATLISENETSEK